MKASPLSFLLGLTLAAAPWCAKAQTVIDYTAAGGNWGTNANWDGARPDTTQIAGINNRSSGTIAVASSAGVGGILFSDAADRNISVGSARVLTLYGTGVGTPVLLSHTGTGSLNFSGNNGAIKFERVGSLHVGSGGNVSFSTRIAADSAGFIKTGEGSLRSFRADNSFNQAITVAGGVLMTNQSSTTDGEGLLTEGPFGLGAIHLQQGTALSYGATTVAGTLHNRLVLEGDVALGVGTETRAVAYAGEVDLHGGMRVVTVAQEVTFASTVSNGGLTKAGAAQLTLGGVNSYTGETRVSEGVLRLEGEGSIAASSRIVVETGATLALYHGEALAAGQVLTGSGSVTGTLQLGAGRLEAGEAAIGQLGISANTLLDGGEIALRLSQGAHDQLLLSGDGLTLTGNTTGAVQLTLTDFDGTAAPGSYLLVSTAGLEGATFNDWGVATFSLILPTHWNGALRMEDRQLYFDLQAIPEPGVAVFLFGGGLLALGWRARQKRG